MMSSPPISTRTDTLVPYTTLFRSKLIVGQGVPGSTVLDIGAVQPAGDLEVLLAAGGVRLRRHPVYDVVESNLAGMRSVVASPAGLAAALIHSPRAGAHEIGRAHV